MDSKVCNNWSSKTHLSETDCLLFDSLYRESINNRGDEHSGNGYHWHVTQDKQVPTGEVVDYLDTATYVG